MEFHKYIMKPDMHDKLNSFGDGGFVSLFGCVSLAWPVALTLVDINHEAERPAKVTQHL